MSRRARRLSAALGGLVALLFAGRWLSALCADRWWAAEVSPASGAFLTDWHFLQLILDITGVVIAAAWFIGHFLVVYRAVGSVQVRRNVANLEIREALTPVALLAVATVSGAVLGLLVGAGTSRLAPQVALAWQGVTYGELDPLLQRDLGLYVAQLPIWRALHGFFMLLVVLGLGTVFGLYLLVGAVRWIEGRPAINSHARVHLGWLLVTLALALMWGYLLEPYELVAGLDATPDQARWRAVTLAAPLLAGVALATAVLSAAWALRARHALAAAGWIVLAGASIVGHWMVPPAMTGTGEAVADGETVARLDRAAYGLGPVSTTELSQEGPGEPPKLPSLWNPATISRVLSADSVEVLSIAPSVLVLRNGRHPVWLAAGRSVGDRLSLFAIADERTGPAGSPLYYHAKDSLAGAAPTPFLELGADASRPGAARFRLHGREGPGMAVSPWPRRVLLAWALQASTLLGRLPSDARVDWELAPVPRLARLAPFATWGEPVPRVIDGELVWLVDGYVAAATFPLAPRIEWRGRRIGSLRAGFVGMVAAETGLTRIFLRPGDDPLAEGWAAVSEGVVEPSSAIPMGVLRAMPYPVELLRVQSRALERPGWKLGDTAARTSADTSAVPRPDIAWSPDTTGPDFVVAYERPSDRRVSALLVAGRDDGNDELRLVRLDSAHALPSRAALESRWSRFPSYGALSDSIRDDGGRLERGPVRFDLTSAGVVAYQTHFARRRADETIVVWVSVASEGRLGAGHSFAEAWSNLLGATVPSVAGAAQTTRLEEARRLLQRADSALRAGDWVTFGRAWDTLRKSFGIQTESDAP
ncbi:MAG TPA: UPF0182 family protein [Gemmatimonadales bacterium]